jgi:hypothetical protein
MTYMILIILGIVLAGRISGLPPNRYPIEREGLRTSKTACPRQLSHKRDTGRGGKRAKSPRRHYPNRRQGPRAGP